MVFQSCNAIHIKNIDPISHKKNRDINDITDKKNLKWNWIKRVKLFATKAFYLLLQTYALRYKKTLSE